MNRPKYQDGDKVDVRCDEAGFNGVYIKNCVGYSDGTFMCRHVDGTESGPLSKGYWYNIDGHGVCAPESKIYPHNPPADDSFNEMVAKLKSSKRVEYA